MNVLAEEQKKLFVKGISQEEFEKKQAEFFKLYYKIRTEEEGRIWNKLSLEQRKSLHKLVLSVYQTKNFLQGFKYDIIKDEREQTTRPIIFVPTHVGKYDIEVTSPAIKDHYYLLSGDYIFRVQSAGNDYVWSPESVFKIRINPPLWLSMPAFIIYTILLVLLVYTVFIYIKRKNHLKLIRIQEKESLRQKEEINQMKFRFFTNISHELRTPLTLIMTPLEVLMQKENDEKKVKHLNVIYKNATDLYNLVNQLLDFRKVEMRMEKLHLTSGDIRDFIASIYTCFTPFAEEKHLEFEIENLSESTNMYFDHDKVHKILNNLLSNG